MVRDVNVCTAAPSLRGLLAVMAVRQDIIASRQIWDLDVVDHRPLVEWSACCLAANGRIACKARHAPDRRWELVRQTICTTITRATTWARASWCGVLAPMTGWQADPLRLERGVFGVLLIKNRDRRGADKLQRSLLETLLCEVREATRSGHGAQTE